MKCEIVNFFHDGTVQYSQTKHVKKINEQINDDEKISMFARNVYDFGTKNTPCRILFLATLALYLVAIPFSRFMMSLAGVIIVINWFLEGFLENNIWETIVRRTKSKILGIVLLVFFLPVWVIVIFVKKAKPVFQSKVAFSCLIIYFVHLLWFITTKNIPAAFADIWIKVPLFFLPIIFYTAKPLQRNEIHFFLYIYVLGVLFSSLFGFFAHLHHGFDDKRQIAVYISYVRLELNICFAIFVSFYLFLQKKTSFLRHTHYCAMTNTFLILSLVWFLFLLIYAGLMTSIILLIFISFLLMIRAAICKKNLWLRWIIPTIFLIAMSGMSLWIYTLTKNYFTVPPFDNEKVEYTADGNSYLSDFDERYVESGNYVFAYLCEEEIAAAWNKRSLIDYTERRMTLIRYLNSKGLRKDRIAVESLSDNDIANVENGIANIAYTHHFTVVKRLHELFLEISDYRQTGTVVGYSLSQRLELWKISLSAIQKNPLLGVGTGDVRNAFSQELEERNSPLAFTSKRSHNQYFTFSIAFGIVGLTLILFSIFYPVIALKKLKEPLF